MRLRAPALAFVLTLPLLACGAGAAPSDLAEVPPRPDEPTARPFRGISELTPEARTLLSQRIAGGNGLRSVAEIKQQIVRSLLDNDVNGNGLSQADFYDLGREQAGANNAQEIGQIFRADYDGNGVVTKAEHDLSAERARQRQLRQFESVREQYPDRQMPDNAFNETVLRAQTLFRNADRNGDDSVTLLEAYTAAGQSQETYESHSRARRDAVFALDFNQDGLVTRQEVEAGVDLFVKEAKEAGVTFPEQSEAEANRRRSGAMHGNAGQRLAQNCNLPRPSAGATVIRLSAYEGQQLSDVSVAGQDEETTTSEVRIDAGSKPLYIVASSHEAQIWRFTGAVNRIEHVVLSAFRSNAYGQPAVGLTGVARDKLTAASANCVGGNSDNANPATLVATLGRGPDVQAYEYGISGIALPSKATYALVEQRPRALVSSKPGVDGAWREFTRFNPAGIYSFNPAAIVSKSKVERYQVLPHQAGITQLLIAGAIEPGQDGYIVRKSFRFPGSMGGAHSAKFIVPKGVAAPSGDPSHNCVMVEGQAPVGPICGTRNIAPPASVRTLPGY